jgi:hypothetical protein
MIGASELDEKFAEGEDGERHARIANGRGYRGIRGS